jgi:UDP-glucose 4-epimerase
VGDPPVLVADASLAGKTLGWRPRHSRLDAIIQSAWNWHSACNQEKLAGAL